MYSRHAYKFYEPPLRAYRPEADTIGIERIACTRIGSPLSTEVRILCQTARCQFPLENVCIEPEDGFEFGYGGSGPTCLAFNILALLLPAGEAYRLRQDFKWKFIAPMDREGGEIEMADVREWIETVWDAELADEGRMMQERELRALMESILSEPQSGKTEETPCET